MAHFRNKLGAAVALNTAICAGEGIAGLRVSSLSLLTDSVHNLSDEVALVFLFLAFASPGRLSPALQKWANLLNTLGLVGVCGLIVWRTSERFIHPVAVGGAGPIVVGLLAAVANWGVARCLLEPSRGNPAVRLAYVHNMGDALVSLTPVAAGTLIGVTGRSFFDPLAALAVAGWIAWSTAREWMKSGEALLAPAALVCGHQLERQESP